MNWILIITFLLSILSIFISYSLLLKQDELEEKGIAKKETIERIFFYSLILGTIGFTGSFISFLFFLASNTLK